MISIKYMTIFTGLSVLGALFSILYETFITLHRFQKITTILTALINLENIPKIPNYKPKVAVGYGACIDLIINGPTFLNISESNLNIGANYTVDTIENMEQLTNSFAFYFKNGAATERYTSNEKMFKNLISIAENLHKDKIFWKIGGNAALMSLRFLKEGANVLLAAISSPKLKTYLPKNLKLVADIVENLDIHLILEYKSGELWGPYTAPRANRFILHNDQNNPEIKSLEKFEEKLTIFHPVLLVISGLQMMDGYKFEEGVRETRIYNIQAQIAAQSSTSLIHFEMACFNEIELLQMIVKNIIPYSDSIGMNEQELVNLKQVMEIGKINFISDSNPRVATTLDNMRSLLKILIKTNLETKMVKNKHINRLHVHTLAYQALLVVKNSKWNNTKHAAAKAALTAFRHVCENDIVNPESAHLVLDDSFSTSANIKLNISKRIQMDPSNPVQCWDEDMLILNRRIEYEICVAPVLVCKNVAHTAGAGDNISAAALFLQI